MKAQRKEVVWVLALALVISLLIPVNVHAQGGTMYLPIISTDKSVTSQGTFLTVTSDCPVERNFNCAVIIEFDGINLISCGKVVSSAVYFKGAKVPIETVAQQMIGGVFWAKLFPNPSDGDRYNYLQYEAIAQCNPH